MSNDDEAIEPCCPMEHPLSFALTGTYTCDICSGHLPANSIVLLCKLCDWGSCYSCITMCITHRCPQEDLVFCARGHGAAPATSEGGGEHCDLCSRDFYESEAMSYCQECDWACCSDCREEFRKGAAELKKAPSASLQQQEQEQQRQETVRQIHLDYERELMKRNMLGL